MLSKHHIKVIKSLIQKKYRQELGLFVVEGIKGIHEFLNSDLELERLYTTDHIFDVPSESLTEITTSELKKISNLQNPNKALAVFKIPKISGLASNGLLLALDAVNDPGNLGTIIRLCDWFGITEIICSTTTVDCYNPKVVQATMGSLTRVKLSYCDLSEYIKTYPHHIFGTFMEGQTLYTASLPSEGLILMGNEAHGISEELKSYIHTEITIPQFGVQQSAESLNVANATAIVLSEFRRQAIIEK